MLNFGASKPRVRGGAWAPGAPPLDPHLVCISSVCISSVCIYLSVWLSAFCLYIFCLSVCPFT